MNRINEPPPVLPQGGEGRVNSEKPHAIYDLTIYDVLFISRFYDFTISQAYVR